MNATTECSVCYDEIDGACGRRCELLCSCGHEFCRPCLTAWINSCEMAKTSRPPTRATCPTCRRPLNDWDLVRVVGHPFRPPKPYIPPSDESDALFRTWLMEQGARPCPTCRMWIIRSEGCNHIHCTCGTNFCYGCGNTRCTCQYEYEDDDVSYGEGNYLWQIENAWDLVWFSRYEYQDFELNMEIDPFFLKDGEKDSAGGKLALRQKGNSRTTHIKKHAKDKRSDRGYHRPSRKQFHRNMIRNASFD